MFTHLSVHLFLSLYFSFFSSLSHTLSLSRPIIIMKWPLSGMCVRAHSVVYMIAIIESANAAVLGQRSNFTFSPAKHNTQKNVAVVHKHGKTGPTPWQYDYKVSIGRRKSS